MTISRKLFCAYPLIAFLLYLPTLANAQCFDYALKYNRAQQQFVTMPNNIVSSLTANFTIELWVYPTGTLSFLESESLFTAGNSTNDFMTLALFSGNNSPVFTLDVNGTEDDIISSAKVTANAWHHIAVVSSGGTATLYLDGQSIGSTTLGSTPSALGGGSGTDNDWLGESEFSSDPFFSGYMDEFRISNIARYTSNFTPPSSPFTPDANTEVLYHFNDATGQIVSDSSGNGYNGVLGATSAVESSDPSWQSCTTLPILLAQFTAALQNNVVVLQWTAYKDLNPGSFEVQHSTDGVDFTTIGDVEANGPEGTFSYAFDDQHPVNGNNYYRLVIIDQGSQNNYSDILMVALDKPTPFAVFPTLASSSITVQLSSPAYISLIDARGSLIKELNLTQSQEIDISFLAKGFYFLINKQTGQVARFIKN
jgi:hypothetical protein